MASLDAPAEMVERWPHLKPTAAAGGLPGGPDNPLGARALYLYTKNGDTLYRIHGTNEPETIGRNVSSGLHPDAQHRCDRSL